MENRIRDRHPEYETLNNEIFGTRTLLVTDITCGSMIVQNLFPCISIVDTNPIRCFFNLWIRDEGWKKFGSGIQNEHLIFRELSKIFGLTNTVLKFLATELYPGFDTFLILLNIRDPPQWFKLSKTYGTYTVTSQPYVRIMLVQISM
jgi:hypothetical protein